MNTNNLKAVSNIAGYKNGLRNIIESQLVFMVWSSSHKKQVLMRTLYYSRTCKASVRTLSSILVSQLNWRINLGA